MNRLYIFGGIFLASLLLSGCGPTFHVSDRHIQRPKKDLHNLLITPAPKQPEDTELVPLPYLPEAPSHSKTLQKRVSVHIQETTELKPFFKELAGKLNISLIIDGEPEAGLHYQACSRPFLEVIETICNLRGLKYTFADGVLRIEKDSPYLKTYSIHFLNQVRKTDTAATINSNILSGPASDPKLSSQNGSSSTISSQSSCDFWEELEKSLRNILNISGSQNETILEEEPDPQDPGSLMPLSPEDQALLRRSAVSPAKEKRRKTKKRYAFAVHRQAGLLSIFGTQRQHEAIKKFLLKAKEQTSTQILIEAKIIEVTLKEEFRNGIDWYRFGASSMDRKSSPGGTQGGDLGFKAFFGTIANKAPSVISIPETAETIQLGLQGTSLSAVLNFMESFGIVRTLSSPRLTVLNNQTALMKVAENFLYFTVSASTQLLNNEQSTYGTLVSTNSTPHSVPIGFVMSVQPVIEEGSGEIILNLRPTISRLVGVKQDPGVQILNQSLKNPSSNIQSGLPIVAVREIDSVLRMQSGSVAMLGGLMIEGAELGSAGLPGTRESPLSFLTGARREARAVTELVIFLKATILKGNMKGTAPADHNLYRNFTTDPRPLPPSS